jgi:pyruvate dehydrogenase E1 component alpha subunit
MADGIPVAAGVALAMKQEGTGRVAMTWFGEGAASRGDFHEGVNLAAVLRTVVFICNNNQYAFHAAGPANAVPTSPSGRGLVPA